jgi:hypothetical protein
MSEPLDELARELGAPPPEHFGRLDSAQLGRLAELLHSARKQQSNALRAAMDDGLGFVPRIARGAVKRALFG